MEPAATTTSTASSGSAASIPAIKENFFQREIADASFRYQSEVEAGQRVIVGVNRYEIEEEQESTSSASIPHSSRSRSSAFRRSAGAPGFGRRRGRVGAVEGGVRSGKT